MLNLRGKITLNKDAIQSPNLCDRFDKQDLDNIGAWVSNGYRMDKQSRSKWEDRNAAAMDLAMQIQKAKNFPWANCANIAFPLVTIGTTQFHARAYPAIVDGANVVKCRILGEDPDGEKTKRAYRVGDHMSWQRLEEDQSWEEQHDRLIINLAVVGSAFKKTYYDATKGCNVGELVYSRDLVLDYYSKSTESSPRKTHVLPMFRNDIYERVQRETFRNVLDEGWFTSIAVPRQTPQGQKQDNRSGMHPPPQPDETTPFITLEQHCLLDLDGDGYAEPYIITIEEASKAVCRIVTRFDREEDIERGLNKRIVKIHPMEYFTKYSFLPSPDGGIYDLGFGVLLGPLNESVNSIVNQLIDAGTMSVSAGGFLGKGAKIRGGTYTFAPLEWKRVDSSGDDLNKSIVPLQVREPSAVLFNLLSLLINYTNRISGASDAQVGENPGQNTPAQTQQSMVEEGRRIYAGIYKRVWRSMKEEFKKLYVLNGLYLPTTGQTFPGGKAMREDYLPSPTDIVPAADPVVVSEVQRVQVAAAVAERASKGMGGYNLELVERNLLRAWRVEGAASLFPGFKAIPPQGEDPKISIEKLRQEGRKLEIKQENIQFVANLLEEQRVNNAKIEELRASALKLTADAKSEAAWATVAAVEASIKALDNHNTTILKHIQLIMKGMEHDAKPVAEGGTSRANGGSMEELARSAGNALVQAGGTQPEAGAEGSMGGGPVH